MSASIDCPLLSSTRSSLIAFGVAPKKKRTTAKPEPAPVPLSEHQDNAVGAVERGLDLLGEKIGDAGQLAVSPHLTVHELRDKFDAIKHHEPYRMLFALARIIK